MKTNTRLKIGQVVQLHPEETLNKAFAGCLMTITEAKDWGAQGYVQALGNTRDAPGGQAYYRARWEEMEQLHGDIAPWVAE